jgi:hypothetical protein
MDRNPYAAPTAELDIPTQGTVSMARYGVLCFLVLLVIDATFGLLSRLMGIPSGPYIGVGGLLISIHLTAACAMAFWVFDEVPALIRRFLTVGVGVSRAVFTALVASAFDVALAAAIVYVTVPLLARRYLPRTSASVDPTRGAH